MYSLNKKNSIHILTLVSIFIFILLSTCQFFVGVGTRAVSTFTPAGGSGTSASPYLIANQTQLNSLAGYVNSGGSTSGKYYKLTENITLSGNHTPIGNSSYKFQGNFDGDGHSIDSLNITGTASTTLGFFGYINGATIKNVYLKSGTISNTYDSGALVGSATGSITIENCRNYGVTVRYPSSGTGTGQMGLGGLIGWANTATGTISSCCNLATVQNYAINPYAGGIVGKYGGSITKCYNKGKVYSGSSSTSATSYGGGICGYTSGAITDCFNAASVDAYALSVESDGASGTNYTLKKTTIPAYAGGICGGGASSISRCYNTGSIYGGGLQYKYTLDYYLSEKTYTTVGGGNATASATLNHKDYIKGTISVPNEIYYDDIQYITSGTNCFGTKKYDGSARYCSVNLTSSYYGPGVSGYSSIGDPFGYGTKDGTFGFTKSTTSEFEDVKDGNTNGIVARVTGTYSVRGYGFTWNYYSNYKVHIKYSYTGVKIWTTYDYKSSYTGSAVSKTVDIFNCSLSKKGYSTIVTDSDLKKKDLGSAWAVSSKINDGFPHLKSMYWEDNAVKP